MPAKLFGKVLMGSFSFLDIETLLFCTNKGEYVDNHSRHIFLKSGTRNFGYTREVDINTGLKCKHSTMSFYVVWLSRFSILDFTSSSIIGLTLGSTVVIEDEDVGITGSIGFGGGIWCIHHSGEIFNSDFYIICFIRWMG